MQHDSHSAIMSRILFASASALQLSHKICAPTAIYGIYIWHKDKLTKSSRGQPNAACGQCGRRRPCEHFVYTMDERYICLCVCVCFFALRCFVTPSISRLGASCGELCRVFFCVYMLSCSIFMCIFAKYILQHASWIYANHNCAYRLACFEWRFCLLF